jgi:hypothetical protein
MIFLNELLHTIAMDVPATLDECQYLVIRALSSPLDPTNYRTVGSGKLSSKGHNYILLQAGCCSDIGIWYAVGNTSTAVNMAIRIAKTFV